jgi:hypothetical protein
MGALSRFLPSNEVEQENYKNLAAKLEARPPEGERNLT